MTSRPVARGLLAVSAANAIAAAASSLTSALMPLALDLSGYAYWQLFSLYSSFAGFFALGFNDGVFQQYSGSILDNHTSRRLATLKWIAVALGLLGATATVLSVGFFPADKHFALISTAACISFFGLNGFLIYTNQIDANFNSVSVAILLERGGLLVGACALLALRVHDYRPFVIAAVASSLLKLVFLILMTRQVTLGPQAPAAEVRGEVPRLFAIGFPVMLAILLGNSILIPSRLFVEARLGPESFAVYSFALTAVLVTGAILTSLAQSIFPLLRKLNSEQATLILGSVSRILNVGAAPMLVSYYFAAVAINLAYPKFGASLDFLGILFPIFLLQLRYALLLSTIHRMNSRIWTMVAAAGSGILLNLGISVVVTRITDSLTLISIAVFVGYALWLTAWWFPGARGLRHGKLRWETTEVTIILWFFACLIIPHWIDVSRPVAAVVCGCVYIAGIALGWVVSRRWLGPTLRNDAALLRGRPLAPAHD